MSEDRKDQDQGNGATRRVPINLGLYHPIGTPQVTPVHALAPGAQDPLPALMIRQPQQTSLFPPESGQQYLSQGPIGSPTVPVSQSIDPALINIPGTGAYAAKQATFQRAADIALAFGPGQFRAYHGTGAAPFEQFLDEFMGTGEGAQAFSWGHYVAGNPGVAKSYVPPELAGPTLDGKDWLPGGPSAARDLAQSHMLTARGDVDTAIADARAQADFFESMSARAGGDPRAAQYRSAANFLEQNKDRIGWDKTRGGSMLNVWVKPDHEEFLDWHLPLDKQEPEVIDKLKKLSPNDYDPDITGEEFYNRLRDEHLSNRPFPFSAFDVDTAKMRASKELDEAGIPGMRFLDQQSRNLPAGALKYTGSEPIDYTVHSFLPNAGSFDEMKSFVDKNLRMSVSGESKRVWQSASDFIDRNKDNFEFVSNKRTYNYVVYDPKNIEITHRDGQRVHTLEPIDHDPWAEQKATP